MRNTCMEKYASVYGKFLQLIKSKSKQYSFALKTQHTFRKIFFCLKENTFCCCLSCFKINFRKINYLTFIELIFVCSQLEFPSYAQISTLWKIIFVGFSLAWIHFAKDQYFCIFRKEINKMDSLKFGSDDKFWNIVEKKRTKLNAN